MGGSSVMAGLSARERIAWQALSWLEEHLSHFDPFRNRDEADEFHQTALAELALTCMVVNRNKSLAASGRLVAFFDLIEAVFARSAFYENLYRVKPSFIAHLLIHSTLTQSGRASPLTDQEIQHLIDTGYATTTERTAFRWLELSYALDAGGFRHHLPTAEELFRLTVLGQTANAALLIEADVYSITHTIFYLTDFGCNRSSLLAGSRRKTTGALIEALLGAVLEAQHWDLAAELLASHSCLRGKDSKVVRSGWRRLGSVQQRDGMICGDEFSSIQEADELVFMKFYHRTLMTALAGFLEPA